MVGDGDDLRTGFAEQVNIVVMSGRAAEVAGPVKKVSHALCDERLPRTIPQSPAFIPESRGGTYCITTTEGRIAVFAILPQPGFYGVLIDVVVWES